MAPNRVNPVMITLARESRGLTQGELAKTIKESQNRPITQGTISKIEQGLIGISDEVLHDIAIVLNYPESFFYRDEEVYSAGMSQHRKRLSLPKKTLNRIDALTNIIRLHIKSLLKSVEDIDVSVPLYDIEEHVSPEKIARMVRQAWLVKRGPIDNVTRLLERSGVIVVQCDFDTFKIDGITIHNISKLPPIIFINKNIPSDRYRFTLSHELGHIVMHKYPSDDMEKEANLFASEFLMPTDDIKSDFQYLTIHKLADLKLYWKVAMSAIIYKAAFIGKITERQSRYLYMQLSKAGYKTREPAELDPPTETPSLLKKIIDVHLDDLNYSINELASILHLEEEEVYGYYLEKPNSRKHLSIVK